MTTPDLTNYLRQELKKGKSSDTIKQEMTAGGWKAEDVDEGLQEVQLSNTVSPSVYKPSKAPVVIIGLILVALLGVGGVLAYVYVYDTPERTLSTMATKLEAVKTYKMKGSVKLDITSSDSSVSQNNTAEKVNPLQSIEETFAAANVFNFNFQFSGQADSTNEDNPSSDLNLNVDYKATQGESVNANIDMRSVNKVVYINPRKMPKYEGTMIDLSVFENQWIKLDTSTASGLNSMYTSGLTATDSSQIKIIKEHKKQLQEAYLRHKFLVFDKIVKSEQISGVDTRHYHFTIDTTLLKAYLIEAVPILSDGKITTKDAEQSFGRFDILKSPNGDIWVGKKDTLPYKMAFQTDLRDDTNKSSSGKLAMDIELSNFNEPVKITAPEGAKTFEEMTQSVMENYSQSTGGGSLYAKARDSQRLSDLNTLRKAIDATMATSATAKLPVCKKSTDPKKCSSAGAETDTTKRLATKGWIPLDISEFIYTLPVDPLNGQKIHTVSGKEVTAYYYFRSDGATYKLATYLEDPSNAAKAANDGGNDPELYEIGTGMSLGL